MTRELRLRGSDPTYPDRTLVQLRAPLDEPEFYCLDVPGFGANAQLQADLTAHTCKPNAPDDEIFAPDPATGQFRMPAYDLCLAAAAARAGSALRLAPPQRGKRSLWTRTDGSDWPRRITSAWR